MLGIQFPLDVFLPDEQWKLIMPDQNGAGILCPNCMVMRVRKVFSGPLKVNAEIELIEL